MPFKDPAARRAYNVAYHAAHREEKRAYKAAYYIANREAERARGDAYYHDPANSRKVLDKLMRQQRRYHAQRLEVLTRQTECSRPARTEDEVDGEVQA